MGDNEGGERAVIRQAGLTLQDIVDRTGMGKPALVRYLAEQPVRDLMQPYGTPPRYPEESLHYFYILARAHAEKRIKPKTAASMLRAELEIRNPKRETVDGGDGISNPEIRDSESETQDGTGDNAAADDKALVVKGEQGLSHSGTRNPHSEILKTRILARPKTKEEAEARTTLALERIADSMERRQEIADARLMTAGQVASWLQMSESWVREHVPSIRMGTRVRYRASVVARFVSDSEIRIPKSIDSASEPGVE